MKIFLFIFGVIKMLLFSKKKLIFFLKLIPIFEFWKILMYKNAIKIEKLGVRVHFYHKMRLKTGDFWLKTWRIWRYFCVKLAISDKKLLAALKATLKIKFRCLNRLKSWLKVWLMSSLSSIQYYLQKISWNRPVNRPSSN